MELDELLPKKPEFTLKSTGKNYTLRLVTLEDHVWLKDKFGSAEAFSELMRDQDWAKAIVFIYRLLIDKSDFMASEESIIDDDGIEKKALITGPFKLLRAINGTEEAAHVMGALAKSIMLSNPLVDKTVKEVMKEELKKKYVGKKSLTRSQANMAGQQKQ